MVGQVRTHIVQAGGRAERSQESGQQVAALVGELVRVHACVWVCGWVFVLYVCDHRTRARPLQKSHIRAGSTIAIHDAHTPCLIYFCCCFHSMMCHHQVQEQTAAHDRTQTEKRIRRRMGVWSLPDDGWPRRGEDNHSSSRLQGTGL